MSMTRTRALVTIAAAVGLVATGCGGGSDEASSDSSKKSSPSPSASATASSSAAPTPAGKLTCLPPATISKAAGVPMKSVGPTSSKTILKCLYRAANAAKFVDYQIVTGVNEDYFTGLANSFKSIQGNEGADAHLGSVSRVWDNGTQVTVIALDDETVTRLSTGLITGRPSQLKALASQLLDEY